MEKSGAIVNSRGPDWYRYLAILVLFLHAVKSQQSDISGTIPDIVSLHISSDIKYRFATTLVTSRVKNPHTVAKEVVFNVTLPNEAFITEFNMEIDGEVYPGEIKEKKVAKAEYEAARSRGESAAHIRERPRETNAFDVQVNIAAESKITFNLTYQELLIRKRGKYHHVIYIDPGQPVQDMNIRIAIHESREITSVRVPPLRNDVSTDVNETASNDLVIITRPSSNMAFVQFLPTIEQQMEKSRNGISGQFIVEYDVKRSRDAGDLLVVNGYFVHFFAPSGFENFPKDVLFILDVSGSMMGRKIKQLKYAMTTILDDLHEGDRLNIMTFSETPSVWKSEMISSNRENIKKAKMFINERRARGGTNINQALLDGLEQLFRLGDGNLRTPMIVFLTDGQANVGESNSESILQNVEEKNRGGVIPIFTLAFGHDSDYSLLKRISAQNNGVARKIYEASDAALQITGFYDEISATLLTDVYFEYLEGAVDNTTVTKSRFKRYFSGSEMVVAGKMSGVEMNTIPLEVIGSSKDGNTVLVMNPDFLDFGDFTNMTTLADIENITEKMWAYLTIKQLMKNFETTSDVTEKEKLEASALGLSLKYKFVTSLTSMVVTKPNVTENGTTETGHEFVADLVNDMDASFPSTSHTQVRNFMSSRISGQNLQFSHHQRYHQMPALMRAPQPPTYSYRKTAMQNPLFHGPAGLNYQPPALDMSLGIPLGVANSLSKDIISPKRSGDISSRGRRKMKRKKMKKGRKGRKRNRKNKQADRSSNKDISSTTTPPPRTPSTDRSSNKDTSSTTAPPPRTPSTDRSSNKDISSTTTPPPRTPSSSTKTNVLRIQYTDLTYPTCFSILAWDSIGNAYQLLNLLDTPDGIKINASIKRNPSNEGDNILNMKVIVANVSIAINPTSVYINKGQYNDYIQWKRKHVNLTEVEILVEPSTVKIVADGLIILVKKNGKPWKGLEMFMDQAQLTLPSSSTGLLATLVNSTSNSTGITVGGRDGQYKLEELEQTDQWHGDSKCYMILNEASFSLGDIGP